MTPEELVALLRAQQSGGFPDLAGAQAAAFVPISDRLLNQIIARSLPAGGAVTEVTVEAQGGNALRVRVRLATPSFLPAIAITLQIERQPELPGRPVLVLRFSSVGLMSLAGPALRFLDLLPPGISVDGERVYVNIQQLLAQRGLGDIYRYLEDVQITTAPATTIVSVRARIA